MSLKAQVLSVMILFLQTTSWPQSWPILMSLLKIESGLGDVWQGSRSAKLQNVQANTTKRKPLAHRLKVQVQSLIPLFNFERVNK